jgi:hypothetical protein
MAQDFATGARYMLQEAIKGFAASHAHTSLT